MKRLAIVTTHPIQYYAPIFKLLHERGRIAIKVFYTWGQAATEIYDPGFRRSIRWDEPLLDGYPYEWAVNTAPKPGSHHYKGIVTPELNVQIENWQPDAVLIFGWAYKGHLSAMRYFKGKVPVFFRGDSTMLNKVQGIKSTIKNIFLKRVYRKVDQAFYVGTNNKAYFKKYGLRDNQLVFAPHAIDIGKFGADRKDEALDIRNKLNLSAGDILILFAGKFEPTKNPELLIQAFKNLRKSNVHLLFLGNGVLENVLKAEAQGNQQIHFLEFQNQSAMPAFYQAANIFCLPSVGETWGLAVNEAMAAGKAILVSDKVGCAVDLVRNDINGEVFKSNSVEALTGALQRLMANSTQLSSMGQQSKKMIQPWNFIAIADAIELKLNSYQ